VIDGYAEVKNANTEIGVPRKIAEVFSVRGGD